MDVCNYGIVCDNIIAKNSNTIRKICECSVKYITIYYNIFSNCYIFTGYN